MKVPHEQKNEQTTAGGCLHNGCRQQKNVWQRISLLVLSTVLFTFLLTGCGNNQAANTTAGTGTSTDQVVVAMGTTSEPEAGFDPCVSWGCGEHMHEPLIQSTLITTNTAMEFVNDLATDYQVSADGLVWTFSIRDDAKFTDGEPLTAADVAFTYNTIKETANSEADLSMLEKATAVNDSTVEFTLNKPFNAFLYTVAVVGIIPEHAYDAATYGSNPIGSGRYVLTQWDRGQQVILEANADYYGEQPQMQKVIIVFMEEDAALAAVKAGEVDIAYTSAVYSDQKIDGFTLAAYDSVDSRGISFPSVPAGGTVTDAAGTVYQAGNNVTCDLALRQAINYALDRNALVANVLNGYGTVAYSVSDNMPWSSQDMIITTDVDKAKTILAEGGWQDSDGDGIVEKNGVKAAFTVYYSANDSVRQALAAEFANQMKNIGLEVSYSGKSWDELYQLEYAEPIVWGWGSNSPIEIYSLFYSTGWGNFSSYNSEITDKYIDQALAAADIADSYKFWQLAQWDGENGFGPLGEASWVWMTNVQHLYFVRDGLNVAQQKLHPHGHGWSLVNNVDRWSW